MAQPAAAVELCQTLRRAVHLGHSKSGTATRTPFVRLAP